MVTTTGTAYNTPSRPGWGAGGDYAINTFEFALPSHLSTKNRRPHMVADWCDRLHAYLGGVVRTLGGVPETIGGTAGHVHLLIGLRATHCLADVLRDIKAESSRWVHEEIGRRPFSWQEGYCAFAVSASQREKVNRYIAQQEEHHRRRTFQEEYLELLGKHGVEYDERYLW